MTAPTQATSYPYDALDDLTTVTQGGQTRTFAYDSLKRLTSANNPESGTLSYLYDNNGNLTQKTDPRTTSGLNWTTTNTYDALNRPISKSYSNDGGATPPVSYYYDNAALPSGAPPSFNRGYSTGRLVAVTYGSGGGAGTYFGYDALGRTIRSVQQTGSQNYLSEATYNASGALKTQKYPSGHTTSYSYDSAGRLSGFTGNLGDGTQKTYSSGTLYSSFGSLSQEQFGTTTPVYNKRYYNSRGQMSEIRVSTTGGEGDTSWTRGAIINHYSDQCWGTCNGTDNNGNLKKQDYYIPDNDQISTYATYTQFYAYDSLNRVQNVSESKYVNGSGTGTDTITQAYVYDRYGNRTINQAGTSAGINNTQFSVDPATNRLYAPGDPNHYLMNYDAAGNLVNDAYSSYGNPLGTSTRIFDAENRMLSAKDSSSGTSTYTYDGNGQRVKRNSLGQEVWQVYGIGGELIAEYAPNSAPTSPKKEYGYRNGQLLVQAASSTETVWIEDALPTGAAPYGDSEGWNWVGANPSSFSGSVAHQSNIVAGIHQHYFLNATSTLAVSTGDHLFAYIYIDPANVPSEIMLQWNDGASFEHRAYWGANNLGWGADGTNSRRYMGPLPAAGQWVRLDVPASQVGLEGATISGMAFSMWSGRATWDHVGKSSGTTATNLEWLVADQLGTPRMVFDQTGSLANTKRHDYLPFGEELFANIGGRTTAQGYSGNDGVRQKFTQKERDNETGLDYFLARYYSSTQGRFTSVDPAGIGASESDPQSWNGYAYARSSPLVYSDPDGRAYLVCDQNGKNCSQISDEAFYSARRGDKQGEYTGNRGFFESGQYKVNGEVLLTYVQISIDDREREFIFEMQRRTAPIPAATAAFFGISVVAGGIGGGVLYALGPPALTKLGLQLAEDVYAAKRLRDLTGMARDAARRALEKQGFKRKPDTGGGYERWKHPDGSEINIRPDGEVVRSGPRQWKSDGSGKFTPRVGP